MKSGIELITEERASHAAKGWDAKHDDLHTEQQMAIVAAKLAATGTNAETIKWVGDDDVWGLLYKHKNNRVRQLMIAGALCAAEIDRIQRIPTKDTP